MVMVLVRCQWFDVDGDGVDVRSDGGDDGVRAVSVV